MQLLVDSQTILLKIMKEILYLISTFLLFSCSSSDKDIVIVCSENPSQIEKFAAKELRRYIYSTTGNLSEIKEKNKINFEENKNYFLLGTKGQDVLSQDFVSEKLDIIDALKNEEYFIHTFTKSKPNVNLIVGGDIQGLLYGTYQIIKSMGVRFYLDGDVIPDEKYDISKLEVNEFGKPLFDKRGIQPFHDFPEGPDWWSEDDYKAILAQLPKLRMNFFGLHTYPEGGVGPEPTVWIGEETGF